MANFILDFISQFSGGRGDPYNDLVRFGLASFAWGVLFATSLWRSRKDSFGRENILRWGFGLAFLRELSMLTVVVLSLSGVISFASIHPFSPPLEHAVSLGAQVVIAGAFMGYLLGNRNIVKNYLSIGIASVLACYLATFWWWYKFISANPAHRFGETWGDWVFRITGSVLMLLAVSVFLRRKDKVGKLVSIAFIFFFLNDFLMLFNLATGDVYKEVFGPIRHSLHLMAIPLFGVVYAVELVDDIRLKERDLSRSEEKFSIALRELPNPALLFSGNEDILFTNRIFTETTGYEAAELKDIDNLMNEMLPELEDKETLLIQCQSQAVSVPVTVKDGSTRDWEIKVVDLGEWEESPLFMLTADDATERNETHRQLVRAQRMEAMAIFTGKIVHDIRNYISGIVGFCEVAKIKLLRMKNQDNTIIHDLNAAVDTSFRVNSFLEQLLAFSRKEPAKLEMLDMNAILKDMTRIMDGLLGDNTDLQINLCEDECIVLMDPVHSEQILVNLISNAHYAMPDGGKVAVETSIFEPDESFIREHQLKEEEKYVLISICDDGCGIPEEIQENIFEPFFTTKGEQGTGLGLSTVYGIVKQNNGYIQLESEVQKGTCFKIYLPLYEQAD